MFLRLPKVRRHLNRRLETLRGREEIKKKGEMRRRSKKIERRGTRSTGKVDGRGNKNDR